MMAEEKPRLTITDFFEENQKLVTGTGVFTALSVFVNQLSGDLAKTDSSVRICAKTVSGLLCLLAVLTLLEVVKNSSRYPNKGTVHPFTIVLLGAFALFVYLLTKIFYEGILASLMLLIVALVVSVFVVAAIAYVVFLGTELKRLYSKHL